MAPRFLQGMYAALGELFYIPFISGKSFENEPRQRPRGQLAQLENYLGILRLSPDSINEGLRSRGVNRTFEMLVDEHPELVATVKSAVFDMSTCTTRPLFTHDQKSEYIADQMILSLPKPEPNIPYRTRTVFHA
jgi:hypothetical protein